MWHGRVFCQPREGFGDRLRVIAFAQLLANEHGLPLSVSWENDARCGVTLENWLDTDFELLPGNHPRPDRQCLVVDCHGALVSGRNPLECWHVLPRLLRLKRKPSVDLSGMVALHYRSTDILFHERTRAVKFETLMEGAQSLYPDAEFALLTDDPKNEKLAKNFGQIAKVYTPLVVERSGEGSEEATMRDWMAIASADAVIGNRSNFSMTAAAFMGKPYNVVDPQGRIKNIYPDSRLNG